jgi:hypothetical protein
MDSNKNTPTLPTIKFKEWKRKRKKDESKHTKDWVIVKHTFLNHYRQKIARMDQHARWSTIDQGFFTLIVLICFLIFKIHKLFTLLSRHHETPPLSQYPCSSLKLESSNSASFAFSN